MFLVSFPCLLCKPNNINYVYYINFHFPTSWGCCAKWRIFFSGVIKIGIFPFSMKTNVQYQSGNVINKYFPPLSALLNQLLAVSNIIKDNCCISSYIHSGVMFLYITIWFCPFLFFFALDSIHSRTNLTTCRKSLVIYLKQ